MAGHNLVFGRTLFGRTVFGRTGAEVRRARGWDPGEVEKILGKLGLAGCQKVGSLVIDNSPNLRAGCDLLLAKDPFRHILMFR